MRRPNKKTFAAFASILVLIIIITILILYKNKTSALAEADGEQATAVKLGTVKKINIPLQVHAIGHIIAPETVMLKAQQTGRVIAIDFRPGQSVTKGQVLLQIDATAEKAQVAQMQSSYLQLEDSYLRYKRLGKDISTDALQQKQSAAQVAKARLAAAKEALSQTSISAPFDGVVSTLQSLQVGGDGDDATVSATKQQTEISLGSYLSAGDNVVLITNPKHIVVQYPIAQAYSHDLRLGQAVAVRTSAYPKKILKGQVAYISPVVLSTGYVYTIRAKINNPDLLLRSGMHVMVTQTLKNQRQALAVPILSLMPSLNGYQVFTVVDNKVSGKPVTVGQTYNTWAEITSGLTFGQKIIVEGQSKVDPGEPVKVVN